MTLDIPSDSAPKPTLPSQNGCEELKLPPLGKWKVQAPNVAVDSTTTAPATSRPKKLGDMQASIKRYTKLKPEVAFDLRNIQTRQLRLGEDISPARTLETESGLKYVLQEGSIPKFQISKSQLPDPVDFYEQVESVGSHYGAVIIDILDDPNTVASEATGSLETTASKYRRPGCMFALEPENFRFRARKQSLRPHTIEKRRKLDFHYKLYHYHLKHRNGNINTTPLKLPHIDRRPLDLYRLHQCVQLRGGFQAVCTKKLWDHIARELGYPGTPTNSVLNSLRGAYTKILADFDKENPHSSVAGNALETEVPAKVKYVLPSSEPNPVPGCRKRNRSGDSKTHLNDVKRLKSLKPKVYDISGSSVEPRRLRDVLRYKGFSTNFEALTDHKKHITKPSTSTLPGYDFSLWQSTSENYDKSAYESKDSPFYNLQHYYEKAQAHAKFVLDQCNRRLPHAADLSENMDISKFEKMFFQSLSDIGIPCDIDSAIDLPSRVHGSGFPTLSNGGDIPEATQPWNLNNVALSKRSALCYLDADYGDQVKTHLDVGMLFSVKGWSTGDNFLPALDYHHLGSSKLWYIIPSSEFEKFEKLKAAAKSQVYSPIPHSQDATSDRSFIKSEFFQYFQDTTPDHSIAIGPSRINTHSICQNKLSEQITVDSEEPDLLVDPDFLKEHNIRYYRVIQNPNSYLLRFPKTYSMNLQSGFSISECTYFAPSSWLDVALESERWLSRHGILPGIHCIQLLHDITSKSKDQALVSKAHSILGKRITKELKSRYRYQEIMGHRAIFHINTFDFISDLSLEPTGISKVVLSTENDCFTMSLTEFISNVSWKDQRLHVLGYDIQSHKVNVALHLFYSNEFLESLVQDDRSLSIACSTDAKVNGMDSFVDSDSFDTLIKGHKGQRVSLDKLGLFTRVTMPLSEEVRETVVVAKELKVKCVRMLEGVTKDKEEVEIPDFTQEFVGHELPAHCFQFTTNNLFYLQKELCHLPVEFPEMQRISELSQAARKFQVSARKALEKNELQLLQETYIKGLELGLYSKYLASIAREICEKLWLSAYEYAFAGVHEKAYSIPDLTLFLRFGLRHVRGEEHKTKFDEVQRVVLLSQKILSELKSLVKKRNSKISVTKLEEIVQLGDQHHSLVDPRLMKSLKAMLEAFEKSKETIASSLSKLQVNDPYLRLLPSHASGETLYDLQLINKFDGSEGDHRLTLAEVPNKSVFTKHVKICKTWLQSLNKLVPKRHLWARILPATEQCFQKEIDSWPPSSNTSGENTAYCFCRRVDLGGTMVACEICGEWYHMACVNKGKWTLGGNDNNVFVCPICCDHELPAAISVEYGELQKLILDSCKLKVIPDRQLFNQIFEAFKIATVFKRLLRQKCFLDDGSLSPAVSLTQMKFFLRKIIGSGVKLGEEQKVLQNACRSSDIRTLEGFSERKINVVTGFEENDLAPNSKTASATPEIKKEVEATSGGTPICEEERTSAREASATKPLTPLEL
ncbi:LADA_0F12398g1_1 [Lachancea dasiensis]|uniref:LADA_0F12398g1_1 n=1 Tax=Lachancea dasiensis TaxID=1072105 RepID=A0A1G4JMH3_9SACH|nr:LADA_0F12398g1_1 [Lachancea dasiensis]